MTKIISIDTKHIARPSKSKDPLINLVVASLEMKETLQQIEQSLKNTPNDEVQDIDCRR